MQANTGGEYSVFTDISLSHCKGHYYIPLQPSKVMVQHALWTFTAFKTVLKVLYLDLPYDPQHPAQILT